jgi:hypothetical protein
MTDEVGVVTGELTLRADVEDGRTVVLRVQYKDAAEWYTVTGGRAVLRDPADAAAVHAIAVALLSRPEEEPPPDEPAEAPPAEPTAPTATGPTASGR